MDTTLRNQTRTRMEKTRELRSMITVIIVSFNTHDVTLECLERLMAATRTMDIEVIVVDNASSDGSADAVAREYPGVKLIRSKVNTGFAGANILGYKHAAGDFVILLNSDAFVNEDAIEKTISYMEEDSECGVVGARLVGRDGSWQPSARSFPGSLDKLIVLSGLAARYPQSRFFGRADMTYCTPTEPSRVDWVPGAFMALRRSMLEEIGFFDSRYFMYYEETDLCLRAQRSGWKTVYHPGIVVVHLGGESSRRVSNRTFSGAGKQLLEIRLASEFWYYRKNHGAFSAICASFVELAWHTLRWAANRIVKKRKHEASYSAIVVKTILRTIRRTRWAG